MLAEDDDFYPPLGPYPDIGDNAGFTDRDGLPLPTDAEYYRGKRADGSIPYVHSADAYEGRQGWLPGDKEYEHPLKKSADEIRQGADLEAIDVLHDTIRFQRKMVLRGEKLLDGAEPPEGVKPDQTLRLALTAARQLPKAVEQWRQLLHDSAARAAEIDQRQAFIEDRAHAVVAQTLLALDKAFEQVGFGSWMPFRYPDQWLMFCGVMRRVLAANGLIHAAEPDVYRRLLEETPTVYAQEDELPGGPRKMPQNWSSCWTNRGARSFEELHKRLHVEVWKEQQERGPPVRT